MKRGKLRALQLAAAASTVSVLALAGAPAFASGITYYQGSGDGQAFSLTVAPSAILSVNLDKINSIIQSLPGAGAVNALAGSTLHNPTAPITVAIDTAHAQGVAQAGAALTDGNATATPVNLDAASLKTELENLNTLLTSMPTGTLTVLRNVIGSDPTLSAALGKIVNDPSLDALFGSIADTLGHPSVNLVRSLNANFGQDLKASLAHVDQGGILTQNGPVDLSLYEARALASDAFADTGTTALKVAPSLVGSALKVPNASAALADIVNIMKAAENAILAAANNATGNNATVGQVTGLLGTTLGTVTDSVSGAAAQVDLTKLNQVIDAFDVVRNALNGLDGLSLNDIVANNGATSRTSLQQVGGVVNAVGHSQLVRVDAININSGPLAQVLNTVTSVAGKAIAVGEPLVTVDGVAGDASVQLDGANKAVTTATGKLVDVKVLGQVVSTDTVLAPGTSCSISVPGRSTCGSIAGLPAVSFPDTSNLGAPVLTITLTRGIFNGDPTASVQHGSASITALEATVDLNTSVLSKLNSALPNLGITLGPTAMAAHSQYLASTHGAGGNAADVSVLPGGRVLDARFGVASATASLTASAATPPVPPKTGNDILPLSILALALVAAGIGLGVRRMRPGRVS